MLLINIGLITECSDPYQPYQISVNFGKAYAYSPHSNEILDWSGKVVIKEGHLDSLFKLTYGITNWEKGYGGCSREYSRKLDQPEWKTDIRPGSGRGLEGIRIYLRGNRNTDISIQTKAGAANFKLGDLLEREFLEVKIGDTYSYQPIAIYLGLDARPRVTKKSFKNRIKQENREGEILVPDDFNGSRVNFMSAYCAAIRPKQTIAADFSTFNYAQPGDDHVPVKLQMMTTAPSSSDGKLETTAGWVEFNVTIGSFSKKVRHFFSLFRQAEILYDIYLDVPSEILKQKNNTIQITNGDEEKILLLHRVYINEPRSSHLAHVSQLPSLPRSPCFWIGYDLNTATTQNGEIDTLLNHMFEQQMGNFVLFRIEELNTASREDISRWGSMVKQFNFRAGTTMNGEVAEQLSSLLEGNFIGVHRHESSNLTYGWGDADPLPMRLNRTVAQCEAAYMQRMKPIKILGQALPMCNLDYKTGVSFISSEFPTGHATLMMAANRGGSYLYNKPYWGVHLANHVMRMPDDETTLRRNFMFLWQSWLYGARLIYDEESALVGIHSTSYSYSDPMSFIRRQQMQELYHYGNAVELGEEVVTTGFLIGKYDCLVGGVQSSPEMEPTKFWGMFGPETDPWKFDTPERGWDLLNIFMPGVWLYPVKQEVSGIRMFLTGSPNGQIDLVTIDASVEKLKKYDLLILPGWNTMTRENYHKLIEYAQTGGHLVLAASQCTKHTTRDFLQTKHDFNFFNEGDLTALSGIKVRTVTGPIGSIRWKDGRKCLAEDLPGLSAELMPGINVLAESETGAPVLVEKKIGSGRVWTLIAGEFWGSVSLDAFRKHLGDTLTSLHRQEIYLTGDKKDVDYHIYRLPGEEIRIAFLNTDWTSANNSKSLSLHVPGITVPLEITEGKVKNILLIKNLAISFTIPGALVEVIQSVENKFSFSFNGSGKQTFQFFSAGNVKPDSISDQSIFFKNQALTIDFGENWKGKKVNLLLEK